MSSGRRAGTTPSGWAAPARCGALGGGGSAVRMGLPAKSPTHPRTSLSLSYRRPLRSRWALRWCGRSGAFADLALISGGAAALWENVLPRGSFPANRILFRRSGVRLNLGVLFGPASPQAWIAARKPPSQGPSSSARVVFAAVGGLRRLSPSFQMSDGKGRAPGTGFQRWALATVARTRVLPPAVAVRGLVAQDQLERETPRLDYLVGGDHERAAVAVLVLQATEFAYITERGAGA